MAADAPVLDGRYTFRNFVVGSGNRLAYAAAKSVAESPGENYTPLVVHAARGLGKTHLLGAIGRQVLLEKPRLEVRYTSARSFADELQGARESGALEGFRSRFRGLDVLLLDDLQELSGHPEAQAELSTALEGLRSHKAQVVLAGDRGPEEIPALDERLRASLRGGLIVDVQNPDYETRAAILRFKIRERGEELSPEVVEEIAFRAFTSVRELEAALEALLTLKREHEGPLTPVRVRELLQRSLPPPVGAVERGSEFMDFLSDVSETISSVLAGERAATGPAASGTRGSGAGGAGAALPRAAGAVPPRPASEPSGPLPPPRPDYTFAGWIAGPSNILATESAQRVLAEPGARYNPLFLHSTTGMGKTHLLNAIGNAFLERNGEGRVAYQSAEEFTEELITAIQEGTLAHLRARYRSVDLLLLDDVQFLAGRERTQEEFFHLFNELHARKRQIVLTSDRTPRELEALEQRLVSRFEGGLVVEIEPLDEATAARALASFLEAEGFAVGEALAGELAGRLRPRSMREIQGHAKRAALRAETSGEAKDPDFLRRVLVAVRPASDRLSPGKVDPFFENRYKVFRHWEPRDDRLVEQLS